MAATDTCAIDAATIVALQEDVSLLREQISQRKRACADPAERETKRDRYSAANVFNRELKPPGPQKSIFTVVRSEISSNRPMRAAICH